LSASNDCSMSSVWISCAWWPPPRRRIASSGCPHRSGEFVKVAKSNHCPLHDRINRSIGRDAIWNSGINTIGFEGLGSSIRTNRRAFPANASSRWWLFSSCQPVQQVGSSISYVDLEGEPQLATVEAIGADNFIGRKGIEVGLCTIVLLAAWLALATGIARSWSMRPAEQGPRRSDRADGGSRG
jgi:hypothetical protein